MRKLAIAAILMAVMAGCGGHSDRVSDSDADTIRQLPDTLRVATLYSPESYFIYRETRMGYDYELVSRLAADRSMTLDLQVAPSLSAAVEMLDSGLVDLIAYEVPVTAEYREHVIPCGPENITTQVLVQPRASRDSHERIDDVTRLVGRDVYVERDSKYEARLRNLNDEIGGGINIHTVDRDSRSAADLVARVRN
ncbi:MAG: transporter substrate-binding domain-containing protein, partial [Duncaniella sp.]|nr:transporter substrate-binding domain-containing protein [Duncaniella sp.]